MTPGQFLLDLWPAIKTHCPNIKFKMVPYENTPENSVEILRNLGQNIDIVAGLFDQNFLENRQCAALELSREPIRCAVSIYHPLAAKDLLTTEDLHGENFLLIRRAGTVIWTRCGTSCGGITPRSILLTLKCSTSTCSTSVRTPRTSS